MISGSRITWIDPDGIVYSILEARLQPRYRSVVSIETCPRRTGSVRTCVDALYRSPLVQRLLFNVVLSSSLHSMFPAR
jgi:hypothetical protein